MATVGGGAAQTDGASAQYYRKYRWQIAAIALSSGVAAVAEAAALVLLLASASGLGDSVSAPSKISDLPLLSANTSTSTLALLGLVGVATAGIGMLVAVWLTARMTSTIRFETRRRLTSAFLASDWESQKAQHSGEFVSLSSLNVVQISNGLQALGQMMRGIIPAVAMIVGGILVSPPIMMVTVVVATVLVLLLRPIVQRSKRSAERSSVLQRRTGRQMADLGTHAREGRVYGVESRLLDRVSETLRALQRQERITATFSGALSPIYQYLGFGVLGLGVIVSADATGAGFIDLGLVAVLGVRALSYGQSAMSSYEVLLRSRPYADDLVHEIAELERFAVASGGKSPGELERLTIRHATYSYPGTEEAAVVGLELDATVGEVIGVVGATGSGKSTLVQLLLGLRLPQAGVVEWNGVASRSLDSGAIASQTGFVPQSPYLLEGSIYDNVSFMRDGISRHAAEMALRAAQLWAAVEALPGGLDCLVGSTGRDLSGGQLQRLALARALAGSPRLLVMDEPTSALDEVTELNVLRALTAERDRITFVVTHRPAVLTVCSRIIELQDGRLVADRSTMDSADR